MPMVMLIKKGNKKEDKRGGDKANIRENKSYL